jgi:hypothetical protein
MTRQTALSDTLGVNMKTHGQAEYIGMAAKGDISDPRNGSLMARGRRA